MSRRRGHLHQPGNLKFFLFMIALSASVYHGSDFYRWLNTPWEMHSPIVGEVQAMEVVITPESTPKPFEHSKRAKQCMALRPDISNAIASHYPGQDYSYELICRESSFNPAAINPTSGACGLAQALPCSKMKCELNDVDCQLDWIGDYVERRYGTFEKAVEFHNNNNWY